jgi:hypothetical protein
MSSHSRSSPRRLLVRLLASLAVLLPIAACGDLPEPFLGNPGATARRLAVPDTPMLAVPPPAADALLDQKAGEDFAGLLATRLQNEEVPTLARVKRKTDWALAITAARKGDQIVPHYAIIDPAGKEQGALDGAPVPAAGWLAGSPGTIDQAAQDGVPKVLALMMSIRATRDRANPNSLLNRAAKLYVPEVTGAPGDGDVVLTRLIRARLAEFGPLVQITPEGTDFTVQGTVVMTPLPKGQQQVEIAWAVTRPSGAVVGKVSQLNAIAAGTLNQFWGDVAVVVTQEASGGVNAVVERFIGRDGTAGGGTAGGGTGGGTGGGNVAGGAPGAASGPGGITPAEGKSASSSEKPGALAKPAAK